jgi:hypothetical protein
MNFFSFKRDTEELCPGEELWQNIFNEMLSLHINPMPKSKLIPEVQVSWLHFSRVSVLIAIN